MLIFLLYSRHRADQQLLPCAEERPQFHRLLLPAYTHEYPLQRQYGCRWRRRTGYLPEPDARGILRSAVL